MVIDCGSHLFCLNQNNILKCITLFKTSRVDTSVLEWLDQRVLKSMVLMKFSYKLKMQESQKKLHKLNSII